MIHMDQVCVEHADKSLVINRENAGSTQALIGHRQAMKQWKLNELEARKEPVEGASHHDARPDDLCC